MDSRIPKSLSIIDLGPLNVKSTIDSGALRTLIAERIANVILETDSYLIEQESL